MQQNMPITKEPSRDPRDIRKDPRDIDLKNSKEPVSNPPLTQTQSSLYSSPKQSQTLGTASITQPSIIMPNQSQPAQGQPTQVQPTSQSQLQALAALLMQSQNRSHQANP
jgi:hypothetical protein